MVCYPYVLDSGSLSCQDLWTHLWHPEGHSAKICWIFHNNYAYLGPLNEGVWVVKRHFLTCMYQVCSVKLSLLLSVWHRITYVSHCWNCLVAVLDPTSQGTCCRRAVKNCCDTDLSSAAQFTKLLRSSWYVLLVLSVCPCLQGVYVIDAFCLCLSAEACLLLFCYARYRENSTESKRQLPRNFS